jgi:hypothetical protein
MSQEKKNDCLFHLEVKGEEVSASIEGKARDISELLANAALHSEEINMVLKMAMMMLIQHEMSQDEDEDENEEDEDEPQTPLFGGVVGQA